MNAARPTGLLPGVACSVLLGCTASPATAPDAGDTTAADAVVCAPEGGPYRVDTYAAHMKKAGENGVLTFELVVADPAPPAALALNAFVLRITHADGTPFTGDLELAPQGVFMPLHNHGPSSPIPTIAFDPSAETFTLAQMNLFMPGLWRVTVDAYEGESADASPAAEGGATSIAPPTPTDVGVFYFCVD